MADPTIYTLANDYARFGLTSQQADTILSKRIYLRNESSVTAALATIQAIIYHTQEGTTPNSLQYWLPRAASASYMVQMDGSILEVIPPHHGPWTTGDVSLPKPDAAALMNQFGWDPNVWSLAYELEGYAAGEHSEAQINSCVWLTHRHQRDYPNTRGKDRLTGHSRFTSYKTDPGWVGDEIKKRVWAEGNPMYPTGMDLELATRMFGAPTGNDGKVYGFNPDGTVSRQWLSLIGRYGPSELIRVLKFDTREYFQFTNYTLWRPNKQEPFRILS